MIEQLRLKNVILIGHSMSGDILLDVDNKYPNLLLGIIGIDNLHEPAGPSTPPGVVNRVMNDVFACDSIIAVKVLQSNGDLAQTEKRLMKGLSHKLHLVNSDVFPIKADSLSKYCNKGYKAELVHATGHYPMIEKPEEFNAALQRVIDDIAKGN